MKTIIIACVLTLCSTVAAKELHLLFMGDSLTEGYGVPREQAYPSLVKEILEKQHPELKIKITNGSVSGSTTANANTRLKWFLKSKPDVLVLALGANDGLRGLDVKASQQNLAEVIQMAKEHNMRIVLTGMLMPPNYGKDYRADFEKMYTQLKKVYDLDFIPFLLDGVAGVKELNQSDGIHPNEAGHEVMAKNVLKTLLPLLKEEQQKRNSKP